MRLTDISIRALPAPEKGVTVYFDDTLTGFGVRVSQAGTKSFVLTHGPRRVRETLGRVGVVSLHDARADTITLPSWLAKNSREHTFPLGSMAKAIIGVPQEKDACVFPALGRKTPFNGHSPCKRKLDKRCGVSDWTLHDIRRTFATGLASLGVGIPVVERLLNHVSGSFAGIVGVYQRYDFMPEMRKAVEAWEAHVLKLI